MKPIIWPYKLGSAGAKELAHALETKCVRSDGNYHPKQKHLIVNWGNSRGANWNLQVNSTLLNSAFAVAIASNKLACFAILTPENIRTVPWTNIRELANEWRVTDDVFCRTKLTGHSGDGIVIVRQGQINEVPPAPLYTKRVRGKLEYRIHVFRGEVLLIQQKRRRAEFDGERIDGIRNHDNGYVFAINDIEQPSEDTIKQCIDTITALGLDFGAVDVIQYKNEGYVLEVNTAPGLEGNTIQVYANKIKELCDENI